jgi:hypothetical protein
MGVYVVSPEIIDTLFADAEDEPDKNRNLAIALRRDIVENMWNETLDEPFVQDWIADIETDHPTIDGIDALCSWIYDDGDDAFASAQTALDHFDAALTDVRDKDWHGMAVFLVEQRIKVKAGLSGVSTQVDLVTADDLLHDAYHGPDISLGDASRLVDLVIDHKHEATQDTLEQTLEYCEEQAAVLHDAEVFDTERHRLEQGIVLARYLDQDVTGLENRIIRSWDSQLETEYEGGSTRDYILVEKALDDCESFAPSSKLDEWKTRLQEIAPQAVEDMTVIEQTLELPTQAVDSLVAEIEAVAVDTSPEHALFSLVQQRPHIASVATQDPDHPEKVRDMFSQIKVSDIGTSVSTRYRTEHEIMFTIRELIVTQAVTEIFERDVLDRDAVLTLVDRFAGLEEEDIAFLTDIVDHYVRGEDVAAYHIGLPYFERMLLHQLNHRGESIIGLKEDGTITSALGTLFETLRNYLDDEYVDYLSYRYTERSGQNRRNLAAHGLVSYDQIDSRLTTSLLLDILAVGCSLNADSLATDLNSPANLPTWEDFTRSVGAQ